MLKVADIQGNEIISRETLWVKRESLFDEAAQSDLTIQSANA
jgi:hypothetical protein